MLRVDGTMFKIWSILLFLCIFGSPLLFNHHFIKVRDYLLIDGMIDEFVFFHLRFQCMEAIENDEADLMTLDSGQGYFAGRQHNMMPVMVENYAKSKCNILFIF